MISSPAWVDNATVVAAEVSKWFGQKVAVSQVSCSFGPGLTGLLGPNGAGKTTLLRMLAGILVPSEGVVQVLGENPRQDPGIYKDVGLVPEEDAVYGFLTARQFVEYAAVLSGVVSPGQVASSAIDEVQLGPDDYYMLGDNSGNSHDSRRNGAVHRSRLVGKPVLIVWPPKRWRIPR